MILKQNEYNSFGNRTRIIYIAINTKPLYIIE